MVPSSPNTAPGVCLLQWEPWFKRPSPNPPSVHVKCTNYRYFNKYILSRRAQPLSAPHSAGALHMLSWCMGDTHSAWVPAAVAHSPHTARELMSYVIHMYTARRAAPGMLALHCRHSSAPFAAAALVWTKFTAEEQRSAQASMNGGVNSRWRQQTHGRAQRLNGKVSPRAWNIARNAASTRRLDWIHEKSQSRML